MGQAAEHDAGRALWLADRRAGIGGSDAATILGVGKYGSQLDVWLDKTGRKPAIEQTEPMWWGNALEEIIARRYSEVTGRALWKPNRVMQHPDHPLILGTPDRLVIGQSRGVEIKNVGAHAAHEWGRPGTDEVPHYYAIQCLHYMAITGFPVWDVAALFGGNKLGIYTVARDPEFEVTIIRRLLEWWDTYVATDTRPPIDQNCGDALQILFPIEASSMMIPATVEADNAAKELLALRRTLGIYERDTELVENTLKDMIGEATGISGDGWKVTWKRSADARRVDWQEATHIVAGKLAEAIGAAEAQKVFADARERATSISPGSRRFRITELSGEATNGKG
jgi:putative phage-type endonuclease